MVSEKVDFKEILEIILCFLCKFEKRLKVLFMEKYM